MLKYKSGSTGEEINLSGKHIKAHIKTAGFYDFEHEVNEVELQNGISVSGFRKKSKQYDLILDFKGDSNERAEAAERFLSIISKDVETRKIGRLYFKECYLNCYIVSSEYKTAGRTRIVTKSVGVYAPKPLWTIEESRSFPPIVPVENTEGFLDYEYDYDYDYAASTDGNVTWYVDHYAPCEFLMRIFGPASNPIVNINGHPYQVFTEIAASEYLTIDSRKNTVVKTTASGAEERLYDNRAKEISVFDPITPGYIHVMWPGSFGVDITLYCERSEPKWKTQNS